MSDKGTNITCQATDDHHKVSSISKTITLDPYCKYNMILKNRLPVLCDKQVNFRSNNSESPNIRKFWFDNRV